MTNCSPGKSFDLQKSKRQGKPKTNNEINSIAKGKHSISNDSGSLSRSNEGYQTTVRKETSIPVYNKTKTVCDNEIISSNADMKLSSLKTQNWLKSLPFNNDVS